MHKVIIEDYYHIITMDENVIWMELTHLLSNFSSNLRGGGGLCPPFVQPTYALTFLIAFFKCTHQRNIIPPLHVYYVRKCLK